MSKPPTDDSVVFTEQARWLLEWHNRRSESLATRAVAILGFDGVILALLLQGLTTHALHVTGPIRALAVLCVLFLLKSAAFALGALNVHTVAIPSGQELQEHWAQYAEGPKPNYAGPNVAESMLNSTRRTNASPLDSAKDEGDLRASRFKWSLISVMAALLWLTMLAVVVLIQR